MTKCNIHSKIECKASDSCKAYVQTRRGGRGGARKKNKKENKKPRARGRHKLSPEIPEELAKSELFTNELR